MGEGARGEEGEPVEIHMNHLMQRALHAYLLRLGERQKNTKLMQFCNYTELWRSSLPPGERRGPGSEECRQYRENI